MDLKIGPLRSSAGDVLLGLGGVVCLPAGLDLCLSWSLHFKIDLFIVWT